MFIFFLQLSNGRILVLYDHDSGEGESEGPEESTPVLVPAERLSMVSCPRTGHKRWNFQGDPVPFTLGVIATGPEDWPEDEGWTLVRWQNIERHYGRAKGR